MVKKEAAKQVKVTLVKSLVRRTERQQASIRGLGLRKLNHSRVLQDTPCVRGMINHVSYMLKVEEI